MTVTYSGFAGPTYPGEQVNGSRGHWRDQTVDIDMGVLHFWSSPEDGPDRYLRQLATPALPGTGVCYQSSDGGAGWSWESPAGKRITDPTKAKLYRGRTYTISRYGKPGYTVVDGSPMPWCYGPGYPCVLGVDGEFHFAANPDDIACNHAPPFNERSIGAVMPGRFQTDAEWTDDTSNALIEALAKLMVYSFHRWGIPVRYCTARDLVNGVKGWTGHRDVNEMLRLQGKPHGNHGDPGANCPWPRIIARALELLNGDLMARLIVTPGDPAAFTGDGFDLRHIEDWDDLVYLWDHGLVAKEVTIVERVDLARFHLHGPDPITTAPGKSTITGSEFKTWDPAG